jgi:hypothetical protein
MATLLQQHRLLALAHAPLRERVAVLQQIAEVDQNNLVWQEDLNEFERQRLKELPGELAVAAENRDFSSINAIHHELSSQRWQELPPDNLIAQVEHHREQLFQQVAREEMERVAYSLNEAFSSFDLPRAQQLRARWNEVSETVLLAEDDPIHELVSPTLQWIADEEAKAQQEADFASAIASLEYALDRHAPSRELERAYHKATRFERELPEFLEARYHKRRAAQELQDARKHKLRLAAVVLAGLVVAGAVGAGIYFPLRARRIAAHADQLASLLDGQKQEEASRFLARLEQDSPEIANHPSIQKLSVRLRDMQTAERERAGAFENLARRVSANIQQRQLAAKDVEELPRLAKRSGEKTRALQLQADHARLDRELQEERNAEFVKKLSKLADKVDDFNVEQSDKPDQMRAEIRLLQIELTSLQGNARGVSEEIVGQVKPLLGRLGVVERTLNHREDEIAALNRITSAVGNRSAFVAALTTYAKNHPESNRTTDVRQVIEEESQWKTVDEWNGLVRAWPSGEILSLSAADATKYLDAGKQFLDKHPEFEPAWPFHEWEPCLKKIAARSEGGVRIETELMQLFADPLVAQLWQVNHVNGKRYFGRNKPALHPTKLIGFKFISDFDFSEKNISLREGDVESSKPAPQNAVAANVTALLGQVSDANWDQTFYKILTAIEANNDMDPVLKLRLMQRTLKVSRQGSLVFEKAAVEYGKAVDAPAVNTSANWLDPDNVDGQAQRMLAAKAVKAIPPIKNDARNFVAERQKLPTTLGQAYRWIGWMHRNGAGKWCCSPEAGSLTGGDLYVFVQQEARLVRALPVGKLAKANVSISTPDDKWLLEGRPVYVAVPDTRQKTATTESERVVR